MVLENKQHIIVSPVSGCGQKYLEMISSGIEVLFGYQTETISFLDDLSFAYDEKREQYNSTLIIEKIEELSNSQGIKVIALTEVDLFIPILTHVYGEAQLGGKASIVSICRLSENLGLDSRDQQLGERIVKEVYHELGHTFGLLHCKDRACLMHYCRTIKDVDRKSHQLCRYCNILLKDSKSILSSEA